MTIRKREYVEGRKAFQNFEDALDAVMKVPHGEIKAKLDAEKAAKKRRRVRKDSKPDA
jgi:hypothetical protein